MKKFLMILAILGLFVGCENSTSKSENLGEATNSAFRVGEKVKLKSVNNAVIELVRTKNGWKIDGSDKTLIFDIFGTYCQPCRDEANNLMNLQLKHANDAQIVALIYYENVSDEHILQNFVSRYNAYYFIANDPRNGQIVESIANDIGYDFDKIALPFKVILKNGEYENLLNPKTGLKDTKYYLGTISTDIIKKNL